MLKKLLKYELRATTRTMGGVYLALAAVSVALGVWLRMGVGDATGGSTLAAVAPQGSFNAEQVYGGVMTVLLLVYLAVLIAVAVLTVLNLLQRFTHNLLGSEGYLMHTLPVSSKQLLGSKLLAALLWGAVSIAAVLLSMVVICLVAMVGTAWQDDLSLGIDLVLGAFKRESGMALLPFLLGVLLTALCGVACTLLRVYAACLIGHQFKRHFAVAGIVAYFLLNGAQSALLSLAGYSGLEVGARTLSTGAEALIAGYESAPVALQFAGGVAAFCAVNLAFGAVYFFLADWLLRTKLNLE